LAGLLFLRRKSERDLCFQEKKAKQGKSFRFPKTTSNALRKKGNGFLLKQQEKGAQGLLGGIQP